MTKHENDIGTLKDSAICAVTLGLSTKYPEMAPAMSAIGAAASVLSFRHVRNILLELTSRIEKMREDKVSMAYLRSPQFAIDIKQLLYEQSLDDLEQKRLLYANYFESCCRCSDIEKIKSQKFFNLLKELDILELAVLKALPNKGSYPKHITSIYNECVPKFNGLTKEVVSMQLETLMSNGLVAQISSQEIANRRQIGGNRRPLRDQPLYYKTILGTKFLQFIAKEQ